MNTLQQRLTHVTMIAALASAAFAVQPAFAAGPQARVVQLPNVVVVGKRMPVLQLPTVVVIGKRLDATPTVVAQRGLRASLAGRG